MAFVVIYLWRGERHRGLDYPTYERAAADARDFVAAGWAAWVERV
jgi:hypothetical protein